MILGDQGRPEGCLSDLALDRWFSGELVEEAKRSADAHLSRCERCRRRHAELSREREEFLARHPRRAIPSRANLGARRRRWPIGVAGAAVAVAAAFALLVWPDTTTVMHPRPGVRMKGGPRLGFFIERGTHAERGMPGARVRPRDRIRFTHTSGRPRYLAIFSLDAAGAATRFFPADTLAELVDAGADVPVRSVVELDDVIGRERIFAVFCDAPFQTEPLRDQLSRDGRLSERPGCHVGTFDWDKEAR